MMLRPLSGLLCCAVCALAAAAACASAEPMSQEQLLQRYESLKAADGTVTCAVEQTRVVILFDHEGKAAALVAAADNKSVRRLARLIDLGETQEAGSGSCIILLRETEDGKPRKRLLANTPLQALAFLIEQNYYHPAALQEDGRVLWATGKRRSVDILVPTTGTEPIRGAELKTDMELTDFAANVVARKLGYPQDSSAESPKAELANALRAKHVYYYCRAFDTVVAAAGKRLFMAEGGRDSLRRAMHEQPALNFPTIFLSADKPTAPQAAAEEGPAEPPAEEKELTPKEALKAFIDRLRQL